MVREKPKIGVLIGTRPGIIKMSPIIHELEERGVPNLILHSGQHYSSSMDQAILDDVGLRTPDYHIRRPDGCETHAQQTSYMLTHIEEILLKEKPEVLLVCGDANTNMAGALAARKIYVRVGHVEAGLRSFDWRMPEEHNRIIIDHISEYLFAPTLLAKEHLLKDGVNGEIFVVGNTIVDATIGNVEKAQSRIRERIADIARGQDYAVLTFHREENVDNPDTLERVLRAIRQISERSNNVVVFPVHPRTKKRLQEFRLESLMEESTRIVTIEPLGYLDFLGLLAGAELVLTDSGGIQEESCILKVPCLTLRESTERTESLASGANKVIGTQPERILAAFDVFMAKDRRDWDWPVPYGDGKAAHRIVDAVLGRPVSEWTPSRAVEKAS